MTDDIPTLDRMFRRAAIANPQALALIDPPDRMAFTGTAPRQLTYVEADQAISAIAARLQRLDLQPGAVVAFQLPNVVESVLLLLGILRAGMIATPLPLLWGVDEIVAAFDAVGAQASVQAVVTMRQSDGTDHASIVMQAAARHFAIRHIGVFGGEPPDGALAFDDIFTCDTLVPVRAAEDTERTALITWDVTAEGVTAIRRHHGHLLAGLRMVSASGADHRCAVLSTLPLSSFVGMSLGVMRWLSGGTPLLLHHAFNDNAFRRQRAEHRCGTLVLPGPAVAPLLESGLAGSGNGLHTIFAVWHSVERWRNAASVDAITSLIDIVSFGEHGFVTVPRPQSGVPDPSDLANRLSDGAADEDRIIVRRSDNGHTCLVGAMVPAIPAGSDAPQPGLDTAGLMRIGGYRLRFADLERRALSLDPDATLVALPHAMTEERLAGRSGDPARISAGLLADNRLLAGAFVAVAGGGTEA